MIQSTDNNKPIIIVGSGGHACVVADVLISMGLEVLGFIDVEVKVGHKVIGNLTVIGTDEIFDEYKTDDIEVVIGVGFLPNSNLRHKLFNDMKKKHFDIRSIIHPSAVIGREVKIGSGSQIFAGSILQPKVQVGNNTIINTAASIDHHSRIGDHSHVAPGAVICGNVKIGDMSFVGAGATVVHGVTIGDNVIIGAGVTVRKDISTGQVYRGHQNV